ncbi:uroporphyrinogen decarboxylase/cobalamine-independent methonine synthase family protein [Arthrobacter pigmenti]
MNQTIASGTGQWPGTDPLEAVRIIRGELGAPHLSFLPGLPERGVGADAVGRTVAVLTELPVDVQPYGWRLVAVPGREHRRAVSILNTDINALADVLGAEESTGGSLKIHLRGPLSLAANLHLHHGERALSDHGARRDILQSFCAGIADHLARIRETARGVEIVVQLDEPEIGRVLAGAIPTASGYRTLRSVPEPEVLAAWRAAAEAAREAGAAEVAVNGPATGVPLRKLDETAVDAAGVDVDGLSMAQWEDLAGAIEAGRRVWLRLATETTTATTPAAVPDGAAADRRERQHADADGREPGEVPQVSRLANQVLEPWRRLGLPSSQLRQLLLLPASSMADVGPLKARRILNRLTSTADALNQVAAE